MEIKNVIRSEFPSLSDLVYLSLISAKIIKNHHDDVSKAKEWIRNNKLQVEELYNNAMADIMNKRAAKRI